MLDAIRYDLLYALRRLRRSPGFAAVAILTLALGIGATTSIFSAVYGVLGRSLPFERANEIVRIYTTRAGEAELQSLSPPNFGSIRTESGSFVDVAAFFTATRTLSGSGEPREVVTGQVGAGFFEVMGTAPAMGRTFRADESEPGAAPAAILSEALWREVFGADPSVLEHTIVLDGVSHTVVGVMPPGFSFPEEAEVWTPRIYDAQFSPTAEEGRASNMWVPAIARLRPGVSVSQAATELRMIAERLESAFPSSNAGVRFPVRTLRDEIVGEVRTPLLVLLGAVGLVLLIACANVAALMLARAAARQTELAVRLALGAGRRRLLQQMIVESLVIAAIGGVIGLLLAAWGTEALMALSPREIPRVEEIGMDGAVAAFAVAITIASGVIVGLIPALRATAGSLALWIREGGRGGTGGLAGTRLRSALVVGEIAVAVVLLAGAGLLVRSVLELMSQAPGFRAEQVLTFPVSLPATEYRDDARIAGFYEQAMERIEAVPGVAAAGATTRLPIRSSAFTSRFRADGWTPQGERGEGEASIGVRIVTPGFRTALDIPLVRGREIVPSDGAGAPAIAVINEAAARRFFPNEDPIGRRLLWFSWDPIESTPRTIVGVVGDVRHRGLSFAPEPEVFIPLAQAPMRALHVVVRTEGDPLARAGDVRAALASLDPSIPAPRFTTLEEVVSSSLARPRFTATLLGLFAGLALILASVGIAGLLAFSVEQRTREFGVRVALGAEPGTILRLVAAGALRLVGIGLVLGLAGAVALSRVVESMLFGVSPHDPVSYALVAVLIALSALVAAAIPARRAARVDPIIALRQD